MIIHCMLTFKRTQSSTKDLIECSISSPSTIPFQINVDTSINVRSNQSFEARNIKYFLTPMVSGEFPSYFKKIIDIIMLIMGKKKLKRRLR